MSVIISHHEFGDFIKESIKKLTSKWIQETWTNQNHNESMKKKRRKINKKWNDKESVEHERIRRWTSSIENSFNLHKAKAEQNEPPLIPSKQFSAMGNDKVWWKVIIFSWWILLQLAARHN